MGPGILQLPEELRCNIAHCLEREDICSLRLACKQLHAAATQSLFSFVRLYPYVESIGRYNAILEHPDFNSHVRHVELNTLDADEEETEMSGEAELEEDCLDAFKAFRKFPNLTGVTLRFSKHATSGNSWQGFGHWPQWTEWPETYEFRQPILKNFFKTLAHPSASKIKDVCIDNMQNMNDGKFMKSETALKVLSRLTALRLYIATEDHEGAPESNLEMEELHVFMAELRPLWLEPSASNLTTLVLYQDFYFGYSPKLDLRGLHIPNLRTLALGNYVFTHDWQLEWLASHSSSLENLYLDDCIVVFYAKHYDCDTDSDGYPIIQPSRATGRGPRTREYRFIDQSWSRILDHFRTHLSSLRHFRIGTSTRWRGRYDDRHYFHPAEYEDLSIGLYNDRYMMFDMGVGPCQYTDYQVNIPTPGGPQFSEHDGKGTADGDKAYAFLERLKGQDREDRDALVQLLNHIRQPLPADTDDVKDLMGRK
ncbi:f-box domain protein [Diplodia corticola]|uniref:F-box domain protein n=1 Tax=Diplodia corticola TaxID=236234 RepID=A0A1J9QYG0_9PEZI|nr:f-box domain protein [Diplodia corticola]OJD33440.1 f-box domain protein [Diplodia corticola]